MTVTRYLLCAWLLTVAAGNATAQGTDELWEMTTSMQMDGMSMPGMTQNVCQKKGAGQETSAPLEKDCKVTESKSVGSEYTFKFVCDGKDGKYSGSGETERLGKDAHRGKMRSSGVRNGEKFDMNMEFSGKRIGNCTWEDPNKRIQNAQAQHTQMMAGECDKEMRELSTPMFFGGEGLPPEMMMCKDRRKEFCAHTTAVLQKVRDSASFIELDRHRSWREAAKACGIDPDSVSGPACKSAVEKKEWEFVKTRCPTETGRLRKAHCEGRNYSTVEGQHQSMCATLGGLSYSTQPADPQAAQPAADNPKQEPNAADKLKDGAKKLKKFLKF